MFRRVIRAALLGGLTVLAVPACAQQFSANIVRTNANGQASAAGPGKIYVSGNKVRIEVPDLANSFFLVDAGVPTSYLVRPAQHLYMESKQSSPMTQFLVPVDVDDPCRQWRRMTDITEAAGAAGTWRCDRTGRLRVAGRNTIGYLATTSKDRQISAWIDPQLKWPVRLKLADGTVVDLENIQEQPQPADLFVVPADFHKFDPRALIELIKQSDVWVEPPK
jgi:hypothetical protein